MELELAGPVLLSKDKFLTDISASVSINIGAFDLHRYLVGEGQPPVIGPLDHHMFLPEWGPETTGMAPEADVYRQMVTGGYYTPGMSMNDLLIKGFHKWGSFFGPKYTLDMLRAQRWQESSIHLANQLGDFEDPIGPPLTPEQRSILLDMIPPLPENDNGDPAQSVGPFQCKVSPWLHFGLWPYVYDDPAKNMDYYFAYRVVGFKGHMLWLEDESSLYKETAPKLRNPAYIPTLTDVKHSIGLWYSGGWGDLDSVQYVREVMAHIPRRSWEYTDHLDPWGNSIAA